MNDELKATLEHRVCRDLSNQEVFVEHLYQPDALPGLPDPPMRAMIRFVGGPKDGARASREASTLTPISESAPH